MIDTLATQVGGDHYLKLEIQPWEVMRAWCTPEEYRGYQKCVIIAYLAREGLKNGDEDILKAGDHMQELVNFIQSQQKEAEEKAAKASPVTPDEWIDDPLHDED